MVRVTCDFETQSPVDLKKAGAYEYSMHPETRPMCFAMKSSASPNCHLLKWRHIQRPWVDQPKQFRVWWEAAIDNPEIVFSAHNAFFEQCIYNNILVKRYGWPEIPIHKWRCSAAKAASVAIPRNLLDAGAVMRTAAQKDLEGHYVMLKLCKPTTAWKKWAAAREAIRIKKRVHTKTRNLAEEPEPKKYFTPESNPEDFEKLYSYCKTDIFSEEDLDHALPDLTPFEQKLWCVDQKINLRGVPVDMTLVNKIANIMASEAKVMTKELDILTMGLVQSGNARVAILDYLRIEGIDMPNLRANTVEEFLNNGEVTGDAKAILKIRKALAKSSTAKYATFQMRAASDGRVRDILLYHGASTGRWGGKGVQPQNFPRGVVGDIYPAIDHINTCTIDGLKFFYGENLMPLFSSVLRGMFIASPGHSLFVEDYSAIECRVLWWLAGHEKGLNQFRNKLDPYRILASIIFNKHPDLVTDEERQVGKAAVLGCGFQMGFKKFITSARDVYGAKVTKDIAKKAVSAYREDNWPVVEMWDNYQNAAIWAVQNPKNKYRVRNVRFYMEGRFLKIELPSGRKLSYCDPQVKMERVFQYVLDGETLYSGHREIVDAAIEKGGELLGSFEAEKLSYMAINMKARKEECAISKWTREKTYGGKLVENVVQAVARDILAEAIVRADENGFDVLMHSHDELVSESLTSVNTASRYRALMETLPTWAEGLPIKSGGWTNERYRK